MITGGAGFIGSALARHLIDDSDHEVLNLDALTYAASPARLAAIVGNPRYRFVRGHIGDAECLAATLDDFLPDVVVNMAAETHVDRSIDGPGAFVATNLVGTFTLLEAVRHYLARHPYAQCRFHHVSTDEVFGSLGEDGCFDDTSPYNPRSPYAASKAGADHLVRAWGATFGLPVLVTNTSNNYGPWQFPEKLVPLMIVRALSGASLPVYGDGTQVRDWLYVDDHVRALRSVFERGDSGETYLIGGNCERTNLETVEAICGALDRTHPLACGQSYASRIEFVADRPGHDRRYALDSGKIARCLDWRPVTSFDEGMSATVKWYIDNSPWWKELARAGHVERVGLSTSGDQA